MSYEETYRREKPCKCGKGTVLEIGEMDDWFQSREYVIIKCPDCAEKERIAAEERKRIREEKQARLKELVNEINAIFEERYMDDWLTYFAAAKNKKAIWELATNIGVEEYSLSSFYQYNKGVSMEKYLRRKTHYGYIPKIMKALHIHDDELRNKVEEARNLWEPGMVI